MKQFICWYQNGALRGFYVSHRRGDGGADWGYTTDPAKALRMSQRMAAMYTAEVPHRYAREVQS